MQIFKTRVNDNNHSDSDMGTMPVVSSTSMGYPPAKTQVLRVSAQSKTPSVAGAIAGVIREQGRAEVQAIGAAAVNQAVKAVAIARGYLALEGYDIICIPAFADVTIGEQERTALKFIVEPRR